MIPPASPHQFEDDGIINSISLSLSGDAWLGKQIENKRAINRNETTSPPTYQFLFLPLIPPNQQTNEIQ